MLGELGLIREAEKVREPGIVGSPLSKTMLLCCLVKSARKVRPEDGVAALLGNPQG